MLVKDIMTSPVITVVLDTPLQEAAEIMADNHIGCLVIKSGGRVSGIITDRDILVFIADEEHGILDKYVVRDAMKEYVITIQSSSTIEKAIGVMTNNRIKKIPVMDGERLSGILTMSDIIWAQPSLIEKLHPKPGGRD